MNSPFTGSKIEDLEDFSGSDTIDIPTNPDSLVEKIRRGEVHPEALRLLITQSMTDADVASLVRSFHIDWGKLEGISRRDKIEAVIELLNKDSGAVHKTANRRWEVSEENLSDLQQSIAAEGNDRPAAKNGAFSDLRENLPDRAKMTRWGILTLGLVAIGMALFIGIRLMQRHNLTVQAAAPTPTQEYPYPVGLTLPGGWRFGLQVGKPINGEWKPLNAEWLDGSEISRILSVPWSEQLQAVFLTIKAGDELSLRMSNGDALTYVVDGTELYSLDELLKVTQKTSPGMAVMLHKPTEETYLVVLGSLR